MTRRCAKCATRTNDYGTITNGLVTVYVCRDDMTRLALSGLVPASAVRVTVSSGR
jgi:hypothetical protein